MASNSLTNSLSNSVTKSAPVENKCNVQNTMQNTTIERNLVNERTLATQCFISNYDDFEKARKELYSLGIKTSYNDNLVICSTFNNKKNNMNIYMQESNGLIIERNTWRLLVVPPRTLRANIDTKSANKFLHQGLYHIYRAEDGTTFNMYYYNNKWTISTSKGYDMNDVKWDDLTYEQLITDCLSNIGLSYGTFIKSLDKTKCYSFGFKHPNFHRFYGGTAPVYKLWFIQYVDLNPKSETYLWAFDKYPYNHIPNQELAEYEPPINMKDLYMNATNALNNFRYNGDVNYGYILRSVNFGTTLSHSDLYIESSLMKTIRKFWYDNYTIDACHKNGWKKEKVVTMFGFLDSNTELFRILFPQYNDTLNDYGEKLNILSDEMVSLYQNENSETKDCQQTQNNTLKYAKLTLQSFRDNVKYNLSNKSKLELKKIFYEYICHTDLLELLVEYF